jgi:hypothetical protein
MGTIQGLRCQLVGSTLMDSWLPDAEPGRLRQFADGCDPSEPNWASHSSIGYAIISLCSVVDWQS